MMVKHTRPAQSYPHVSRQHQQSNIGPPAAVDAPCLLAQGNTHTSTRQSNTLTEESGLGAPGRQLRCTKARRPHTAAATCRDAQAAKTAQQLLLCAALLKRAQQLLLYRDAQAAQKGPRPKRRQRRLAKSPRRRKTITTQARHPHLVPLPLLCGTPATRQRHRLQAAAGTSGHPTCTARANWLPNRVNVSRLLTETPDTRQ
jgi:hypothetical protein